MDIINFTWSAMAGGAFYDGIKMILGSSYQKLNMFVEEGKKEEFESHLETIFSVNNEIKTQLEDLQLNGNNNSYNNIYQNGNNNSVKIGS